MRPTRSALSVVVILSTLALLGTDCDSTTPQEYTTPAELVGAWLYVSWYENGMPKNLAQYYACQPATADECSGGVTTYAASAYKEFYRVDTFHYKEFDQDDLLVYWEGGETTVNGSDLFLKILTRNGTQLTPSQRETEGFTWEIVNDTLTLTRTLQDRVWVLKLIPATMPTAPNRLQ